MTDLGTFEYIDQCTFRFAVSGNLSRGRLITRTLESTTVISLRKSHPQLSDIPQMMLIDTTDLGMYECSFQYMSLQQLVGNPESR